MSTHIDQDLTFKALASGTRRRILDMLRDHPRTTGDLCDQFPRLNRCTVMQHLEVLVEAGLVIVRRNGRQRWNYLNALPIKHLHDRWIGEYATFAVEMLERLREELDGEVALLNSGDATE